MCDYYVFSCNSCRLEAIWGIVKGMLADVRITLNIIYRTIGSASSHMILKQLRGSSLICVGDRKIRAIGWLLLSVGNKRFIIKGSFFMRVGPATPLLNQNIVEVNHYVTLGLVDELLMLLDSHRRMMLT